ncbi:cysteine desulfurase-like protein [Ornithinimicrobium cryptoxanthini]|uniref:Cysteine desulfurase-like protein n=1 Tax=Ornithinimicrobium cryptoxanthini TaxID=2934161 RepID=A0ABY4YJS7_9MICO|nr:cysteine desulfurase-like protein [Ornithinimicrobium cryptoxanthini]USQ76392.1 cysteine desulfurase-like protein [Ornithinimicrobium cryptoxanthini]
MGYDVTRIRSHFPALLEGAAHFDGPGGTQTPDVVAQAVAGTLTSAVANRGTVTAAERRAEAIVLEARTAVADLLGADPVGVVFGRSATDLTFHFSRTLSQDWGEGDEVVVTRLDHDANVRPWVIAAEARGATVRFADFDPATGELTPDDIATVVTERTRVVAVTAASNLIGTRPDLPAIAEVVHAVGALLYVDGVHATAHVLTDLPESGADFWVCSPYKFLGPHHGVLAARPDLLETLRPDKLLPSPDDVPERFELGTLPYEMLAGTTAAVDFLAGLDDRATGSRRARLTASYAALEGHEDALLATLEPGLRELPGVTVYANAGRRTPTTLFTLEGHDPQEIRRALADVGVNAPASHFYAWECSQHLGLGDSGGVRVGLAPYTSEDDVVRLLDGLRALTGS